MAYNTATRLLLKFNEANASATTVDSSEAAHIVSFVGAASVSSDDSLFSSNVAKLGEPDDSEAQNLGGVVVTDPSTVFSSSTSSAKRIDLWYKTANWKGNHAQLLEINVDDGAYWLKITVTESGAFTVDLSSAYGDSYDFLTVPVSNTVWNHLRVFFQGDELRIGLNGNEVLSFLGDSTDLWVCPSGSVVTYMGFGAQQYGGNYLSGYLDNVELLEGDTSWTSGAYTVPTNAPEGYGSGPDPISGSGANTVDGFVGIGYADLNQISTGSGQSAVSAVTSTGAGNVLLIRAGVGGNSTAVTSHAAGLIGEGAFTTLLIHGNTNETPDWSDVSLYNRTVTGTNVTTNTTTPKLGDGALSFNGTTSILSVTPASDLFVPGVDKTVDFFYRYAASSNGAYLFYAQTVSGAQVFLRTTGGNSNLYLNVAVPGLSASSVSVITPVLTGAWAHVRLAFVGQDVIVAIDGIEKVRLTVTGSAGVWPASELAELSFGGRQGFAKAAGLLDEIRIIERSGGYLGGDFTVPFYEYTPNMSVGGGSAIATVSSAGVGTTVLVSGSGANATTVSSQGYGVVGGAGAWVYTVADVVGAGAGYVLPVVMGSATNVTEDVRSHGTGYFDTFVRGKNTTSVYSYGAGTVGAPLSLGAGANRVSVSSSGVGLRVIGATRLGTGGAVAEVFGGGAGYTYTNAVGKNLVSVSSKGAGYRDVVGLGKSSLSVSSKGSANSLVIGTGSAVAANYSAARGIVLPIIYGSGNSTLGSVTTNRQAHPRFEEIFSYSSVKRITLLTKTHSAVVFQ